MGCVENRDLILKLNQQQNANTTPATTPSLSGSTEFTKSSSFLKLDSRSFISRVNSPITDFYRIQDFMGEGTYGSVKSAYHIPSGNMRAVKSIPKQGIKHSKEPLMMMELEILRRTDHPNIVRAYELYEDANYYHLVTELCKGGELLDRILLWSSPSETSVAKIFHQIMSAVSYCHDLNIVHRDIKPENVLFVNDDPDSPLKLIDFGVSCLFSTGEKMRTRCGSAFYIAPEVIKQSYDEKSDVWSCGVVLYVMLCGCPPFPGSSNTEIMSNIVNKDFEFFSPEWDGVSNEAKSLISMMLNKNPDLRPTAHEVLGHPWLNRDYGLGVDHPLASKVMTNLAKFKTDLKLQYVVLSFITSQLLTQEENLRLTKVFSEADLNKDGLISAEELKAEFVKIGMLADIDTIINECDANGNGYIDYSEFLTASIDWSKSISQKRIENCFNAFDVNRDGVITKEELSKILGCDEVGIAEEMQSLIDEVDLNKDGVIDLDEFKQALLKHQVKPRPAALKLF